MKITNLMTMRGAMRAQGLIIFSCLAAALVAAPAGTTVLTYNTEDNYGWFDDQNRAWGDGEEPAAFNKNWIAGASAIIASPTWGAEVAVVLTDSPTVGDLTLEGRLRLDSSATRTITMSGGDVTVTDFTWGVLVNNRITLQGDYTVKGGGWLRMNQTVLLARYDGTATFESGIIQYQRPINHLGTDSHIVLTGGTVIMERNGTHADHPMGSLTVNSGSFDLGLATRSDTYTLTVSRFAGTGAAALVQSQGSGGVKTFVVDQTDNTSYEGSILGASDDSRLVFEKAGSGDLTLTGQVDLRRTTTVSGGRLYINSEHTAFSDEAGATAISVDGGTLGGTGTIMVTDDADVVVGADGKLAAGIEGQAGRTTVALDGGTLNLSDATASANTGWLKFDLGSHDTAGTTYDQIQITGGALNIGDGLNFNDFDFVLQDGFRGGKFVLFETSAPIVGTLGTTMGTGEDFSGAEILIEGNNLVLTFPPPGTLLMIR